MTVILINLSSTALEKIPGTNCVQVDNLFPVSNVNMAQLDCAFPEAVLDVRYYQGKKVQMDASDGIQEVEMLRN